MPENEVLKLDEKNIALTEEERDTVIANAVKKATRDKRVYVTGVKYRKKVFAKPKEVIVKPSDFISKINEVVKGELKIDDTNRLVIDQITKYFAKFGDLDPNKGLMVAGPIGCGKTSIMNAMRLNPVASFYVVNCRRISNDYADAGNEILNKYCSTSTGLEGNWSDPMRYFNQEKIGFCFDDLGAEDPASNYGNKRNVMAEIIQNIYERGSDYFKYMHITTNLTPKQIEEYYGWRVRDRLKDMCNLISYPGAAHSWRS